MDAQYVLNLKNIEKEYYGNKVLKGVSLKVKPGEIHALMGENGAGKSTLMNILFGMPVIHSTGGFNGTIEIMGEEVKIDTPIKAMECGIGMVHQEFMLIPGFNITENIKIGREISYPTIVSKIFSKELETLNIRKMAADARKALNTIGMTIDEYTKVAGLPVGYMQFIEIAREIDKTGIKLLVFDEPTAVLTESEAEKLLETMKLIASKGIAIIFITHRLDEVMEVADSLTVLRDGEYVAEREVSATSVIEIAELMIGRKVEKLVDDKGDKRKIKEDEIALSLKNFFVEMPGEKVRGVDLEVKKGEIFGIGGLAGQGKLGIANGIFGLYPTEGEVLVFGNKLEINNLGEALKNSLAFVSEDRRGVGLLLEESIENNIAFSAIQIKEKFLKKYPFFTIVNSSDIRKHAEYMKEVLDIRCTSTKQKAGSLSGGNQQKVCLARALTLNPEILIVSEPTRGIDIGAKKLVLEYLSRLNREEGITIIMISSELVELRSLCDRIGIVSDGKLVDILVPDSPDSEFGLAMAGSSRKGGYENDRKA